jgi:hypothetical protein
MVNEQSETDTRAWEDLFPELRSNAETGLLGKQRKQLRFVQKKSKRTLNLLHHVNYCCCCTFCLMSDFIKSKSVQNSNQKASQNDHLYYCILYSSRFLNYFSMS